jgi:hypothetical protein
MLLVCVGVPSAALGALHSDIGAVIVIPELGVVQLADCVLHVLSNTTRKDVQERIKDNRGEKRGQKRGEERTDEWRIDDRRGRKRTGEDSREGKAKRGIT